jgi:hypothetical protein
VPGVYTCSAVCRNNVGRSLEGTLYYNSRTSLFCENANGFDNYNVCWWHAYNPGYVRFTSRTDGPGDTFDIFIYMISGQYKVLGDDPPFPQASTITSTIAEVNTGTPTPIVIGLSSLIGSTITIQAKENISLLANIAPPAYISSGNITIAGSASVELIGQQAVVGGLQDVNIDAVNGSLYLTGNSTIQIAASTISIQNYVDISGALFAPQVVGLSSINGSPFTGGGGWVGTATSDLDMANYNINNLTSITSAVTTMTLSNTSNIAINAPNISIGGAVNANCNAISNVGDFSRYMISTELLQPVIQYGQVSSSGSSGTVTVTIPQRYTSVSSYLPFAVMGDAPAAEIYVCNITRATFEIGWQNGGGGTQIFNWHTMGT